MRPPLHIQLLAAPRPEDAGSLAGLRSYRGRIGDGPWSDLAFAGSPALAQALGAWGRGGAAPELPGLLLAALGAWGQALAGRLAREPGRPQLALALGAPELHDLPWELLPLGPAGAALGLSADLRVCWPDTHTARWVQGPQEQVRALVAWSGAGGPVPAEAHAAAWQAAWTGAGLPWDPQQDTLPGLSVAALQGALTRATQEGRPVGTLHLLCHGVGVRGGVGLALDGSDGPVPAEALAAVLAPFAGTLRLVVLACCRGGDAEGAVLGSVAGALHRAGLAAVIACRRPFSIPGSSRFSQLLAEGVAELHGVERALAAAREALAQTHPDDATALTLMARPEDAHSLHSVDLCPYPGLRSFGPRQARFFFGREQDVAAAERALLDAESRGRPRLLVVAGPSGVGKSSVVKAGLAPRLAQQDPPWPSTSLRPGAAPLAALEAALGSAPAEGPLLLEVDQLEELFTHSTPEDRVAFLGALWSLATGPRRVWVVCSWRVDFAAQGLQARMGPEGPRLDQLAEGAGPWAAHRLPVAELGAEGLREIIVRPAEAAGLHLPPGLAEALLREAMSEAGAQPLLAYTLARLWARRRGRVLLLEEHQALGGVAGALRGAAEEAWAALDPAAQRQARRLLVSLVDLGTAQRGGRLDARRRVPLATLRPEAPAGAAAFEQALAAFVERRLLVRRPEGDTVEVAHEALLRAWPQIAAWVEEDREQLARAAALERWLAEAEGPGALQGARLRQAERLQAQAPELLSARARERVAAAQALRRRRRWQRNGLRAAIGALVLCCALAGAAGLWYLRAMDRAQAQSVDAALLAEVTRLEGDPQRQARLLRAAQDTQHPAWQAAARALPSLALRLDRRADPHPPLAWEPGGERVLVFAAGGLLLVDPLDRAPPLRLGSPPGQFPRAAWGAGQLLIWDGVFSGVQRWASEDLVAWQEVLPPREWDAQGLAVAVSADAAHLALSVSGEEGAPELLLYGPEGERTVSLGAVATALAFEPSGALLVGNDTGLLGRLPPGGERLTPLYEAPEAISALAVAGGYIWVGDATGAVVRIGPDGRSAPQATLQGAVVALSPRPGHPEVAALGRCGELLLVSAQQESRRLAAPDEWCEVSDPVFPPGLAELWVDLTLSELAWSPDGWALVHSIGSYSAYHTLAEPEVAELDHAVGWSPSGGLWRVLPDADDVPGALLLYPPGVPVRVTTAVGEPVLLGRPAPAASESSGLEAALWAIDPLADVFTTTANGLEWAAQAHPEELRLWRASPEGPTLARILPFQCTAVAWTPDAARLACAGEDVVEVLDASTGAVLGQVPIRAQGLAFSPDGQRLAIQVEGAVVQTTLDPSGHPVGALRLDAVPSADAMAWDTSGRRLAVAYSSRGAAAPAVLLLEEGEEPITARLPCPAEAGLRWVATPALALEAQGTRGACAVPLVELSAASPIDLLLPLEGPSACVGPAARIVALGEPPSRAEEAYARCLTPP